MEYRVYCNFVVEADSQQDVVQFLNEDSDFVEKHIIVKSTNLIARLLPQSPDLVAKLQTYYPEMDEYIYADIRRESEIV